jgi:GTP pyrophosphokinase
MVYVEPHLPATDNPSHAIDTWLEGARTYYGRERLPQLASALRHVAQFDIETLDDGVLLKRALARADVLVGLRMDVDTIIAAILIDIPSPHSAEYPITEGVQRLLVGLIKLREMEQRTHGAANEDGHTEAVRQFLLAIADDLRVVFIQLADRLVRLRQAKNAAPAVRDQLSRETLDLYAPLANRLGIWQIKWELEDLSLRYQQPQIYREIANALDGRRVERQQYVKSFIDTLEQAIKDANIRVDIKGRAKHIYSIWKKMVRKGVGVHDLYDVLAVRVQVETIADCYHVLGIVHGLWQHIPREFDDYIAHPKENGYRSIHTAVVGPEGKIVEVQIRTQEMDNHAELGVAAHWLYKEGGSGDRALEAKIAWIRKLMEQREGDESGGAAEALSAELFEDRVFVFTPHGKVIDLPSGATPLDFAYQVHTEVGHRCRGAKVDGRIVPLSYQLQSGEQIEILTAREGSPSRDWLNPHLGYLNTNRARAKVRTWFRQREDGQILSEGKACLERELTRLGIDAPPLDRLAHSLSYTTSDGMLLALGRGELTTGQLVAALAPFEAERQQRAIAESQRERQSRPRGDTESGITIRGVGSLLTHLAGCCKPMVGDPIVGYVTLGRGVTIHRRECATILNLPEQERCRLIEVAWEGQQAETYPVDIELLAVDRKGLLRDIYNVMANEEVDITATHTQSDRQQHMAKMQITAEVHDLEQLSRVLQRLDQIPNVQSVRRKR